MSVIGFPIVVREIEYFSADDVPCNNKIAITVEICTRAITWNNLRCCFILVLSTIYSFSGRHHRMDIVPSFHPSFPLVGHVFLNPSLLFSVVPGDHHEIISTCTDHLGSVDCHAKRVHVVIIVCCMERTGKEARNRCTELQMSLRIPDLVLPTATALPPAHTSSLMP